MDLYDLATPVETALANRCDTLRIPYGGTMELLPLCNMNCTMCYIRQTKEEMDRQGRMLTLDEWLRIAREAMDSGVLHLLLTGGEPLLYPQFRELYTALTDMGFIITINTNGTLIDESMADFFAERPCRRLNITLYGKDDATYGRLCNNSHGFTQVMHAVNLLKERQIPFAFNVTMTPENADQLTDFAEISRKCGTVIRATNYLFPPLRRENVSFSRLSPEEAIDASLCLHKALHGENGLSVAADNTLRQLKEPPKMANLHNIGCRAGRSGFWITWNGELRPCGMFEKPSVDLKTHSFQDAWKTIVEETSKLYFYKGCQTCDKQNVCRVCAAGCLTESGDMTQKPDYICQMTDAMIRRLLEYVH